jgi:hypothetical protein
LRPQFEELSQKKLTSRVASTVNQGEEVLFACEDWQAILQKKFKD